VSPGPIDTPIIGKAFPDKDVAAQVTGQMREASPMKRFGTSEEIAKAVLFLAFDATYTTGANFRSTGLVATVKAVREEPTPMTDTANHLVTEQGKLRRASRPSPPG